MTKRTDKFSLDPNVDEIEDGESPTYDDMITAGAIAVIQYEHDQSLQRLIDSGIVTATDSVIAWRTGHLEHVAALYVSDPAQTWRDYADDLTVALAADGGNFAALVERARGE